MLIVGINSSPRGRRSATRRLLEEALRGAEEGGAETQLIDITRLDIGFCTGCTKCYRTGSCSQKDDYAFISQRLLAANGVILSSPNYISNIAAPLKAVFDRSANFVHEQLLEGKYGFSIMTAGAGQEELILGIMNEFIVSSGGTAIGGVGVSRADGEQAMAMALVEARAKGRDLVLAIEEERLYPSQREEHMEWKRGFAKTIKRNRKAWKHNYEYWVDKGWIKP